MGMAPVGAICPIAKGVPCASFGWIAAERRWVGLGCWRGVVVAFLTSPAICAKPGQRRTGRARPALARTRNAWVRHRRCLIEMESGANVAVAESPSVASAQP
jgi:hypothetical protein